MLQRTWAKFKAWWKPLPRLAKAALLFVAIAPVAWHYIHKALNPPFELQISQPGAVPYDIYLVDVQEVDANENRPAADNLRLEEGTLLRPFGLVARFYNLVPKRAYQVTASVEDDDGEVLHGRGAVNMQSDTGSSWVYFPFYPDLEKHSSGSWKAKFNVSGVGTITHHFKVKDLTADEKLTLAQHEEAREQAKLAFTHAWVVVPHQKIKAYTTAVRENSNESDPLKKFDLIQVAGLDYKMEQLYLSPADRLNGITYRGIARFSFTVYRLYDDSSGWGEWLDVERQKNEFLAPLMEAWTQMFSALGGAQFNPDNIQLAPHMIFQLEKRDGHWWTTTQEEMRFIDGTRHGTGTPTFIAVERNSRDKQLLTAERVFQPSIEFVAKISDDGKTPRSELLALAKSVVASPDVLKKQQKQTMEALE
jgi:hypothetical protein